MNLLISGEYNAFKEGYNGAGVYMASGLFQSETFSRPVYIGSAVDLRKRIFYGHLPQLECNDHCNQPLQRAWNNHSGQFVWWEIESCPRSEVRDREQYYLDLFRPFAHERQGYNIAEDVYKLGSYPKSEETKRKISQTLTGRPIEPERRKKISETLKGRKIDPAIVWKTTEKLAKPFRIVSPEGEIIEGKNLKAFCRDKGLCVTSVRKLLKGQYKDFKGWSRPKEESQ